MKTIKDNLILITSILLFAIAGLYAQNAYADMVVCQSCGGSNPGADCYSVDIGPKYCFHDTYDNCYNTGTCDK